MRVLRLKKSHTLPYIGKKRQCVTCKKRLSGYNWGTTCFCHDYDDMQLAWDTYKEFKISKSFIVEVNRKKRNRKLKHEKI